MILSQSEYDIKCEFIRFMCDSPKTGPYSAQEKVCMPGRNTRGKVPLSLPYIRTPNLHVSVHVKLLESTQLFSQWIFIFNCSEIENECTNKINLGLNCYLYFVLNNLCYNFQNVGFFLYL